MSHLQDCHVWAGKRRGIMHFVPAREAIQVAEATENRRTLLKVCVHTGHCVKEKKTHVLCNTPACCVCGRLYA
jgi:hypothetical protein